MHFCVSFLPWLIQELQGRITQCRSFDRESFDIKPWDFWVLSSSVLCSLEARECLRSVPWLPTRFRNEAVPFPSRSWLQSRWVVFPRDQSSTSASLFCCFAHITSLHTLQLLLTSDANLHCIGHSLQLIFEQLCLCDRFHLLVNQHAPQASYFEVRCFSRFPIYFSPHLTKLSCDTRQFVSRNYLVYVSEEIPRLWRLHLLLSATRVADRDISCAQPSKCPHSGDMCFWTAWADWYHLRAHSSGSPSCTDHSPACEIYRSTDACTHRQAVPAHSESFL